MYKLLNFILFFCILYTVQCKSVGDPNSEVESLNERGADEVKDELRKSLLTIDQRITELKEFIDEAKKTMADSPGSEANVQRLLTMNQEIGSLKASLQSAREKLKKLKA